MCRDEINPGCQETDVSEASTEQPIQFPEVPRRTASAGKPIARSAKRLLRSVPLVVDVADRGRTAVRRARSPKQIEAYLGSHQKRKLRLGAGFHALPGWLSVDIARGLQNVVYMDLTKPFPLPSDSFDFAQCEHMIEHIPYGSGLSMLGETHRVLRKGGVLRIATPDLDVVRRLLTDGETDPLLRAYVDWSDRIGRAWADEDAVEPIGTGNPAYAVNRYMRWFGHMFIYDERTLREALESAGFHDVVVVAPGESAHPDLRGIDRHHEEIGEQPNLIETLVMEATA